MDMYKQKFCLDQEQPYLGYADVKLNMVCMHPLACLHTLSLCVYCDLYVWFTPGNFFYALHFGA